MNNCAECRWEPNRLIPKKKRRPYNEKRKHCRFTTSCMEAYRGEQWQLSTMDYLNRNGDCPYFEIPRPWWKVWRPK
jgi:hypothetical protein